MVLVGQPDMRASSKSKHHLWGFKMGMLKVEEEVLNYKKIHRDCHLRTKLKEGRNTRAEGLGGVMVL